MCAQLTHAEHGLVKPQEGTVFLLQLLRGPQRAAGVTVRAPRRRRTEPEKTLSSHHYSQCRRMKIDGPSLKRPRTTGMSNVAES